MRLLTNDQSMHGQFHDIASFRKALAGLMGMRSTARRFGQEVHCHRALLAVQAQPGVPLRQTLGRLSESERRAAIGWMTRSGPFWDDLRSHGADDWLECRGEVVTDTAVGEAAFRTLHNSECGLISMTPSEWEYSPVEVIWRRDGLADRSANLGNWWHAEALERELQTAAPPIRSWDDLRDVSHRRFNALTFADDCFMHLRGIPFGQSAVERILVLFDTLDRLACAFDAAGRRTPEGHEIVRNFFTGDRALFSDSSDTEKREFRNELTFGHPDEPGEHLFCTWHGKVRAPVLRVHYSWSGNAGAPLYVAYAGPKITKR